MFPFLYILTSICYLLSFDNSHPNSVRCYFIIVLIHISLMICDAEHISMFNVVYPLWRNMYSIPLPNKNFFALELQFLFWILSLYPARIYGFKLLSIILWLPFHLCWLFLVRWRRFLMWCNPACVLLLLLMLWCHM